MTISMKDVMFPDGVNRTRYCTVLYFIEEIEYSTVESRLLCLRVSAGDG